MAAPLMLRQSETFLMMCHIARCSRITATIRSMVFHDGTGCVGLYDLKGPVDLSFIAEKTKHPKEQETILRTLYRENHKG